jgi:Pyridine nucleotide-disulphide oxidoreductase
MRDVRVPYDYLVIAAGARHSYFGHDEWAAFAPGLKQIDDATSIRSRLLFAFEQAENAESPAVQREMLTFVIVGGGPTGVELAGAIAELARHGLAREFRAIDPSMARVILMQAGPRILPTFPQRLSRQATAALTTLGVEVLTDSAVERIDEEGVVVSCRTMVAGRSRSDRSGEGRGRLVGPRAAGRFRDWRYCSVQRLERQPGARPRARSQAAGPLRRLGHQGAHRGPAPTSSLPLSPCRQSCDDWPEGGGRRFRLAAALRCSRLVGLGGRPHPVLVRDA